MTVKVLVVDDSALVRKVLTKILSEDEFIEVVGTATDPHAAREKIKRLNPDVITLDVEMPKMDGITFLEKIMHLRPMPVVMVSSLTEKGADTTLRALELGAVDFVTKPKLDVANGLSQYSEEITYKVRTAARAKVKGISRKVSAPPPTSTPALPNVPSKLTADAIISKTSAPARFPTGPTLLAIGSSTGGTEAVKEVLSAMPANSPPTVITQHIPKAFSGPFAQRVNGASAMEVCEAQDGQEILPGHAYIAPGDKHLLVERTSKGFYCKLHDGPRVNRHKPSVDVLFRSVAQTAGANAIGVILTGMGDDGAVGMKEMQDVGAVTIAQDEQTSVVWGMPGSAVKLGAADSVLPLSKIASAILSSVGTKK